MSGNNNDLIGRDIFDLVYQDIGLRHCTILSNVPIQLPGSSFISIDPSNPGFDVLKMTNFIHKTTWCLVVIIHLGIHSQFRGTTWRTLIERNVHANVFLIGNTTSLDLGSWNKPVVILERAGIAGRGFRVHVYCGRRYFSYWRYDENYWQSSKGFSRPFGLRGERCLPLLFNQPFIVGYYGLLPNIFVDDANDSVSGTDVEAIRLLADKYQMKLEFRKGSGGDFTSITSKNATHNLAKLYRGEYQASIPGLQFYHNFVFFDLSNYVLFSQMRYAARQPQKTVAFENVARGFDKLSWAAVFLTLTCFAVTFQTIFYVYKFKIKDSGRYNNPGNPADFFLLTFTSFVEPDKINWFPTWSAGKMSALMWSVFALLVVSFYTSNLRTNLIAPSLEPEINSHEDILKYDKFIHANNLFVFLRRQKVSPGFEAVLRWVDETGGWFSSEAEEGSLEPHVETGVLNNGDVYFTNDENVLYSYLFQQTLGFPNLRISNDALNNFYMSIRIQKYSPYTPEVNDVITTYHELGLFKRNLYKPIPIIALPSTSGGSQYESSETLRMSLEMLWTPIILLSCGCIIGAIILLFEIRLWNPDSRKMDSSESQRTFVRFS
ncbi:hypothetical protein TCAL_14788 [Tigriopus californicus]|uniref:Ionotropic glutamate receptor C-terminal domain-containing protein n=1 Tax=Tigriopus californicus TaxID=6832 RepID=A0A553PQ83_TIGCA|nr:uncharacterized protein LOC131882052 [Tigriopus californicus]TRY79826.1 hypothetical protein TCAL_14788 [Tigriopus californicus]